MYMSRVFLGEPYLRNAVVHELEADGFGAPLFGLTKLCGIAGTVKSLPWWWGMIHTFDLDGQNPAPPRMMINPIIYRVFNHPRWCRISSINSMYMYIIICCYKYQAYLIPLPLHDLDVGGQQRRLKEQAAIDAIWAREVRVFLFFIFGRLDCKTKNEEYDLKFNMRLWIIMICWMFSQDVSYVKIKHHLLYCYSSVLDLTTCWLLDGTVYHGRNL